MVLFEKEICEYLRIPSIPLKEWDGKSEFKNGVAVVSLYGEREAYAVASSDEENGLRITKVFAQEQFGDVKQVFVVPSYMDVENVENMDLDEESKKRAEELAKEAEEIENEGVEGNTEEPENEYSFDFIHNDEEAVAFIKAYNKKNKISGNPPKKHESIVMRLAVIFNETKGKK